ncbi:MAG: beta-N-acetylhexosaminidase [Roseinatronobacter sp.]
MTEAPRAVIFGCAGHQLSMAEQALLRDADPFGAILFTRNLDQPDQIRALCNDWRQTLGRDIPILIDQEGGRVQRLTPPLWRGFLPPLDVGLASPDPARAFWLRGRLIALELRALGIDVNCAPVADLARPETHAVLRNRCMGVDPAQVAANARAYADGLLAGGVIPVLKHIPGHGRATLDSHLALPRVQTPRAALEATDFATFRALADLPMGMTAHLLFERIDPDRPATQSPVMLDLIRQGIGFDGLLMTDDISMQALAGSVAERAQAALAAGCDLVLHCNGDLAEMRVLADSCPPMTDTACMRAARALALRHMPAPIDAGALDAEHAGLMPKL